MANLTSAVLIGAGALIGGYAPDSYEVKGSHPIVFSRVEGREWVEEALRHYPEISWLASSNVRKTEEGNATLNQPYSEQLFGQKFIEFDRTLMTLHCLRLILERSDQAYHKFTEAQPQETRLSKEHFQELHLLGERLLKSGWGGLSEQEMGQVMETALVLGDIGKSEQARELLRPFGIRAPDHDDFYGEAMQLFSREPDLCPSFLRLPEKAKELLVKVANLAHYGHITHLEGVIAMFEHLKTSDMPKTDPIALDFDLFVHSCDVAGALGHVNNQSSIVYDDLVYRAKEAMGKAVKLLSDSSKTSADAYRAYVTVRAHWLGLNPENGLDRVLARIGAMLRLSTPQEGMMLKQAVALLIPEEQEKIISALDVQKESKIIRTPTYMPAVLVNLLNNPQLGKTKEERLSQAILWGLPFIARVLQMHEHELSEGRADPKIPLNFNKMAGVAKSHPERLKNDCKIDAEGNVEVAV